MTGPFACGHPRDEDNAVVRFDGRTICRTCRNARQVQYYHAVPSEKRWLSYRMKNLPKQLALAEARVRHLRIEAERLGILHLLENGQ